MSTLGAKSIGILMDGNRRWAKARGLPTMDGHLAGLKKAKEIVRHAFSQGVETIFLYAFSTENWNRSPEEVGYLMRLFKQAIQEEFAELARDGVQVRFIGDLSRLSEELRTAAKNLEEKSKQTTQGKTLAVALSYGGRAEIVSAINTLLVAGKKEVDEEEVSNALWSAGLNDPDILIRTGGEKRLSNFLPWQSVYSELFFTDTPWPDFSPAELDSILSEFSIRERRHGK